MAEMTTKKCKYCASDIPIQAIQCSVCKNYQVAWRNNLLFAAGVAGFITLIASAITFTIHEATGIYKGLFWHDDLKVLELIDLGAGSMKLILSNRGDGPVFADEIVVYSPAGGFFDRRIDRLIPANAVELIETKSPRIGTEQLHFVANTTGWPTGAMIESITAFTRHCFLPLAYDVHNSYLKRMQDHYDKTQLGPNKLRPVLQPTRGALLYFSVHSNSIIESTFPVSLAFVRSDAIDCQDVSVD
jgi:hypothetical protein